MAKSYRHINMSWIKRHEDKNFDTRAPGRKAIVNSSLNDSEGQEQTLFFRIRESNSRKVGIWLFLLLDALEIWKSTSKKCHFYHWITDAVLQSKNVSGLIRFYFPLNDRNIREMC